MDPSFSPYHFNLAQMPTDQREHKQHPAVQTEGSIAETALLMNASRYSCPCPPGENWSTFRFNPMPGSMISYHHPGYTSNAWDAKMPEPHELSSDQLRRDLVPENAYLHSLYLAPQSRTSSVIASPTRMENRSSPLPLNRVGNDDDFMNWPAESITPSFLPHSTFHRSPAQMETSRTKSVTTHTTSPSPEISISSQQSPSRSFDSMSPAASATATDSTSPQTSFGDNSDQDAAAEPPYSKLIFDALMSTQEKMMPLQEIYAWFEKNTSRGKDKNKGWQNSIRHNLSMNAGFEAFKKEEPGKKPINYWRLTNEARINGVQSTTRYRKASHRKVMSSDPPAPGRQRSGPKGGRAARHATKMRPANHDEQRREHNLQSSSLPRTQRPHTQSSLEQPVSHPAPPVLPLQHRYEPQALFEHRPIPNSLPVILRDDYIQTFSLGNTIDITNLPPGEIAVVCDTAGPNPDFRAFDMGQLDWYRLASGLNSGFMTGSNGL